MFVLNTIMADQLLNFTIEVKKLTSKGIKREDAIFDILKRYIKESKPIRFEGNSYSEKWLEEAAKRKLSNHRSTPEALQAFISDKTIQLFKRHKEMNEKELNARYEIKMEKYVKKVQKIGRAYV